MIRFLVVASIALTLGCSSDTSETASNAGGGVAGKPATGGSAGSGGASTGGASGGGAGGSGGSVLPASKKPFGCDLDPSECAGPADPCNVALSEWPDESAAPASVPLTFDEWMGPYMNASGEAAVAKIDAWYADGSAAGLFQDKFRSFDGDHSSIREEFFPQIQVEAPTSGYQSDICGRVLGPRVSSGVMSFGTDFFGVKAAVLDAALWSGLDGYYASGAISPEARPSWYRVLYEHNAFFIHPGAASYENGTIDRFNYLSPFYLHSIGMSGTDSALLKPILFASASIPRPLKTRILRAGLLVPTLMQLFKSTYADIHAAEAHVPAFTLPAEAEPEASSAPLLDQLIERAHSLTHIPPVARIKVVDASGGVPDLLEETPYAVFANVTSDGPALTLTLDLSDSWTDENRPISSFDSKILRGPGTIEFLDASHSRIRLVVPFGTHDYTDRSVLRTDVLLMVSDGSYDSAPAYVSVRHVQDGEFD